MIFATNREQDHEATTDAAIIIACTLLLYFARH
jgi:hypothetical protein